MRPQPHSHIFTQASALSEVYGVEKLLLAMDAFAKTRRPPDGFSPHGDLSDALSVAVHTSKQLSNPYHWWHRLSRKSPETRAFLALCDCELVKCLIAAGCFQRLPKIEDSDRHNGIGSYFIGWWGSPGEVILWSRLNGSCSLTKSTDTTISRWFTLLHEVSHQEFRLLPSSFCPSPHYGVSGSVVGMLNDWTMGPLLRGSILQRLFEETFADTYAAMLLWRLVPPADRSRSELHINEILRIRKTTQEVFEDSLFKQWRGCAAGELPVMHDNHLTAPALARLWEYKELWQASPLHNLKQIALRISSDSVMDLMSMSRVPAQSGFPVDAFYRFVCVPDHVEVILANALIELSVSSLHAGRSDLVIRSVPAGSLALKNAIVALWPSCHKQVLAAFPGAEVSELLRSGDVTTWSLLKGIVLTLVESAKGNPAFLSLIQLSHPARMDIFDAMVDKPIGASEQVGRFPLLDSHLSFWREMLTL